MNIVLYGGAFNPPHAGHRAAVQRLSDFFAPDLLLVMPTGQPMHKPLPPLSPTPQQRLELCRLTFGDIANVEVSDYEISRPQASYTVDTVQALKQRYPNASITLGIGSDMLLALHQWHNVNYLCKLVNIAVLSRTGADDIELTRQAAYLTDRLDARITIVPHEPVVAGSFALRALLRRGGRTPLLQSVQQYIDTHWLYRSAGLQLSLDEMTDAVESALSPERFAHSVRTAQTARQLAQRWGADPDDAYRAGLLHDLTKSLALEAQLHLCRQYDIMVNQLDKTRAVYLHGRTGAALAFDVYGESRAVACAIECHTTGGANMDRLAQCLYLADKIEPQRSYANAQQLRTLAEHDLNAALLATFSDALRHLLDRNAVILPEGLTARNELLDARQ